MMQKLFDHMDQTHGLILTESELQDIVSAVGMDVRLLLSRMVEERDRWQTIATRRRVALEYIRDNHPKGAGEFEQVIIDALDTREQQLGRRDFQQECSGKQDHGPRKEIGRVNEDCSDGSEKRQESNDLNPSHADISAPEPGKDAQ